MKKLFTISVFLLAVLVPISCADDYDDNPTSVSVNDFIWKGLNQYYYWLEQSPDLADIRFSSDSEYYKFIDDFTPIELFNHLLYEKGVTDRFSVIYSDYTVLEQALTGNSATTGMEYKLYQYNGNNIFGVVTLVLPNSNAETNNIRRGDIFIGINDTALTTSNYESLLYNNNSTFNLNMATISGTVVTPNSVTKTVTKTPYSENPVYLTKTIMVGSKKVGYLMYNGFYIDYEDELNDAFAYFQSEGITHLVLDLRYNGGGSIATATRLASMITGQFTGQLFAKQEWNYKLQDYITNSDNNFTTTLDNNASINSLNLNSVYVITSKRTASASELVINGLKPYINVVQIGDDTYGKNVGSVTLYDSPTFRKENLNPNHRYAMQPIVLKVANAVGFSDYTNGLAPNISQVEDPADMGVLGETSDPLLETALNYIDINGRFSTPKKINFKEFKKSLTPVEELEFEMYVD